MSELMSNEALRRSVAETFRRLSRSTGNAWPRIGRDLALVDEDGPAGSVLFACRMDESMSNPLGIVHGGVTASLMDTCMGVTCAAQCDGATPTVTMTVNYARPVPLDAEIRVRAYTVRVGATSAQMRAEAFRAGAPDEVLLTASGIYAVKRTMP